ncbi:MAG: SPOR domain-containing protein [Chitinophagales bacterium]|nr:SPOR domain-containing protein [Bacteroidota bacterium]MCB9043492.1 SPOR domain-containing protein [Chitinophagales bacterium]
MKNIFLQNKLLYLIVLALVAINIISAKAQVTANASPAITALLEKSKVVSQRGTNVSGYRIQILQSNNREEVYKEKNRFVGIFPQTEALISYDQPYFKLRAGAFTNRFKAYKLLKEVKPLFQRAFLVRDEINSHELKF